MSVIDAVQTYSTMVVDLWTRHVGQQDSDVVIGLPKILGERFFYSQGMI